MHGRQMAARRRLGSLVASLALLVTGQVLVAGPATAGQVGVTVSIRGSGSVTVVEGSIEDGASTTCSASNLDDRVSTTCPRIRNEEAFEAWVWLRPTPGAIPSGHWQFGGWQGCDSTRTGTTGASECGVHSGAFDAVERQPVAIFDDFVAPTISVTEVFSTLQDRTVSFFLGTNEGTTFQCRIDTESFSACSSGSSRTFTEGPHTFEARGSDASGNVSGVISRAFTVIDTALVDRPPAPSSSQSAEFTYSSGAGIAFECSIDSVVLTSCPNAGKSYTGLAEGTHTFRVRAVNGGWFDRVPVTFTWTIDVTPPNTALGETTTDGSSATFGFTHDGSGSGFDCRLLEAEVVHTDWQACDGGSRTFSDLEDGEWTFEVRARDAAGNVDPTPVTHTWTVDTTPPDTTVSSGPAHRAFRLVTTADFAFAAGEDGATYACTLDGAEVGCPGGVLNLSDLAHTTHTVTAAASDARGNQDPSPAVRSWTVPRDDTELARGKGWKTRSAASAYLGTFAQSTRKGAALTQKVTGARKVALVVVKGRGYGKVKVYAGTKLVKTVDLAAKKPKAKQLVVVTTFTKSFTGKLKIVVASNKKIVRIDGLGVEA